MLTNLKIGQRLALAFGLVVLMLVIATGFAISGIRSMGKALDLVHVRTTAIQIGNELEIAQYSRGLLTAGIPMMADCRRGECGLCQLDVVSTDGVLDHRDVFPSDHQKEEGHKICACVSRVARGNLVIDTADRSL